jgi:hypothetical protein
MWLKGGVGAEGDDTPAGDTVFAAKIVPAGKSVEDATGTLTVADPEVPGEDLLPAPHPQYDQTQPKRYQQPGRGT